MYRKKETSFQSLILADTMIFILSGANLKGYYTPNLKGHWTSIASIFLYRVLFAISKLSTLYQNSEKIVLINNSRTTWPI